MEKEFTENDSDNNFYVQDELWKMQVSSCMNICNTELLCLIIVLLLWYILSIFNNKTCLFILADDSLNGGNEDLKIR